MIQWLSENRRATYLVLGAFVVLLLASALAACQIEDLVKVDVPPDVAAAIDRPDSIPVSASTAAWDDWVAYVERQSRRFAESIDRGEEIAGVLRGLTETGIAIGQDAAATVPGGAFLSTALGLLGGLFIRRPGDADRERREKEASYNAGIERGRDIATSVAQSVEALREAQGGSPS